MARLTVEAGPAAGSVLEVTVRLVVGRAEDGVGSLGHDPKLSRRHASITVIGSGLVIEDLESRNGTLVSGRRISHPVAVAVGDVIELGSSRLRVDSTGAAPAAGSGAVVDAGVRPLAGPPGRTGARRHAAVVIAIVVAALVVVTVQVLTRSSGTGSSGLVAGVDGTVYVETGVAKPDQNSVLAIQYRSGLLRPLVIHEYPTGGSGAADLKNRGILDGDQQLAVNADDTLLFAVNQGSDSIAVFSIAADGSLTAVPGSPFPSGGLAPISVGVDGNLLVVANKAEDGVRNLKGRYADYATMFIGADGALTPTGHAVQLPPGSSPTQALIADGGRLLVGSLESGDLQIFTIDTSTGTLTAAPGYPLPGPGDSPASADGGRAGVAGRHVRQPRCIGGVHRHSQRRRDRRLHV